MAGKKSFIGEYRATDPSEGSEPLDEFKSHLANFQILFIFFLFLLKPVTLHSQQLMPFDFNTASNDTEKNNYALSYTIGGTFSNTLKNNNYMLTQGFHQPVIFSTTWINKYLYASVQITAFPNPGRDKVNIILNNLSVPVNCYFEIYDLKGQQVLFPLTAYQILNGNRITLDISHIEPGCYLVYLIAKDGLSRIAYFKLIKV